MVKPTSTETPPPWVALEDHAETFRQECEALDQLVDELFEQLEEMNRRLAQKSAEAVQQQAYAEEREQQWLARQNEQQDLREFFVHQNDQIALAIEKLSAFEQQLGSNGSTPADQSEILGLLSELKAGQEGWRQLGIDQDSLRQQENERFELLFQQQSEQLTQALDKLSLFQDKLQTAAQAGEQLPNEQLTQLLNEVREQHQWLREQAEAPPREAFTGSDDLKTHFARQEEQLADALEKIAGFEQQLAQIAAAEGAAGEPSVELNALLDEIREQREEFRQHAELDRAQREHDHEALEAYFARHSEQLGGTLGKLNTFEDMVKDLAVSIAPAEEEQGGSLSSLLEELRRERDELRQQFDQARDEARRLAEVVDSLAQRSHAEPAAEETADGEQLRQELAVANGRVLELEQTVARQQEELLEEKQQLREQLRELRELLEARSQWDQPARPAPTGNQTIAFSEVAEPPAAAETPRKEAAKGKKGKPSDEPSVLAQFAKLSRK